MDAMFEFEEDLLLKSTNAIDTVHRVPIIDENNDSSEFELYITRVQDNSKQGFISLLNMDSDILISDVKFLVALFSNEKIPAKNQILTYCEQTLMDDKTLGFYKITASSLVCLELLV
ncbi:putative orfan [Tupanvirus soda lake]|uniref:Orfan n=2 Tax=Tupanvirus TaxID=2094720 RepID=A0AC62AD49_9VIRU|nr:putative orfan [Tupanvirus soda lake]QKU35622.1 putative orfan [Tupanvirus soda lake]